MSWADVGQWIKDNATDGAALVGSLLLGNIPGAVAAGVAMVSSATGSDDPSRALQKLQNNPEALIALKQIAYKENESIRKHIEAMQRLQMEVHTETQKTIRSGDNSDYWFNRMTRPAQSWCCLFAAFAYVFTVHSLDTFVLMTLLTIPFTYAGLRQIDKEQCRRAAHADKRR